MSKANNRHGLNRTIPAAIKREVRQRCGFGCVSCGKGIIQYDHFDPEFVDATVHDAAGITLLCGSCHDEKKHGLLTNNQVREMDKNPFCKENGHAFGQFRLTGSAPRVLLGSNEFVDSKIVLEVAGEKVLWFKKPTDRTDGLLLNARIRDKTGKIVLEVVENEWRAGVKSWDIDTSGNGIVIRNRSRKFSLILRFLPPETIKIERAVIRHKGVHIRITKDGRIVDGNNNSFSGCSVRNCYTGIRYLQSGRIQFGCGCLPSQKLLMKLYNHSAIVSAAALGTSRRSS